MYPVSQIRRLNIQIIHRVLFRLHQIKSFRRIGLSFFAYRDHSNWLMFFSCQFYRYLKIKRILRNTTENLTDSTYIQIMQDEFSDKQITPSLQIFQYQELDTPFVIGVFRPIIILPLQSWTTDELQLIIEHESIHIRQWDNLIKILVLCMLALEFLLTVAWYVLYQWNLVAELSCDYKIMTGRTKRRD